MEIKEWVTKQIAKYSKIKFNESTALKELKIDSLSLAEIIFDCENEFNIRINDDDLKNIHTVGDAIKAAENAIKN